MPKQRLEFQKPVTVSAAIYTEDGDGRKRSFPYIRNSAVLATTVSVSDDNKTITLVLETDGTSMVLEDIDAGLVFMPIGQRPTKLDLGVKDALIKQHPHYRATLDAEEDDVDFEETE